jgi:hypothetical protein
MNRLSRDFHWQVITIRNTSLLVVLTRLST